MSGQSVPGFTTNLTETRQSNSSPASGKFFNFFLHLYIEGLRKGTCIAGCFWWKFEHTWKCTGCGHCRVTWSLRRVVVDWNIFGTILTSIIIAVEKRTKIYFQLDFLRRDHRRTSFGILIWDFGQRYPGNLKNESFIPMKCQRQYRLTISRHKQLYVSFLKCWMPIMRSSENCFSFSVVESFCSDAVGVIRLPVF